MYTVFLHGANSSSNSFTYILKEMRLKKPLLIDYDSNFGFYLNLENIVKTVLNNTSDPVNIVSHSLGGIYAIHLTKYVKIKKAVSIATPFGGSAIADWAKYMMPQYQLFRDVGINSMPIIESRNIELHIPWKQIVTTSGKVPWLVGDNDGVVTKKSMTIRDDVEYTHLHYNHYEVMCSSETVSTIKKHFH